MTNHQRNNFFDLWIIQNTTRHGVTHYSLKNWGNWTSGRPKKQSLSGEVSEIFLRNRKCSKDLTQELRDACNHLVDPSSEVGSVEGRLSRNSWDVENYRRTGLKISDNWSYGVMKFWFKSWSVYVKVSTAICKTPQLWFRATGQVLMLMEVLRQKHYQSLSHKYSNI